MKIKSLCSGAARVEITPTKPLQLSGYPHVRRISEGAHDPLWASALYLDNGRNPLLLIAVDLIFLDTPTARACRCLTASALKMEEAGVCISCTHTHSGPNMVKRPQKFNTGDMALTAPDPSYVEFVVARIQQAAIAAKQGAKPARLAWTSAEIAGVGTNRHNPEWTTDRECGILITRACADNSVIGIATMYGMHPTVMHEDSRFVSSDFPHYARERICAAFGTQTIVCYHNAPSGNQSPRHVVKGQTFAEAERLGGIFGDAVVGAIEKLKPDNYSSMINLGATLRSVDLPQRNIPPLDEAEKVLLEYRRRHQVSIEQGAPRAEIRTAECAVFGAERLLQLARFKEDGTLEAMMSGCLPVDVQAMRVGSHFVAALPGELFAEYALRIKAGAPGAFPIAYANGMMHGYVVTPEAAAAGGYEAAGSILAPEAGAIMADAAIAAIKELA